MKKIFFICLFLFGFVGIASAQQWVTVDSINVLWDPVTVSSGTVSYKTYFRSASGGPETFFSTVTTPQATITFTVEGRYFVGVKSIRNVDGIELESSTISWTDNPAVVQNGVTFGVQYYSLPGNVGGLRKGN